MNHICPCGSGKKYQQCCEPIINGSKQADTAEALLRSRFTAYAQQQVDYICQTTHPDQVKPDDRQEVAQWARRTQWHELTVVNTEGGGPDDEVGTIEFIANYSEKGIRNKHHEIATFKKMDGKWFFYDGHAPTPTPYVRSTPKVGRNAPCPCGSGKKYKKCCGKA